MLSLLFAILLNTANNNSHISCSFRHIDACKNTNQLIGSPNFRETVAIFMDRQGRSKGNYLYHGLLLDQQILVLGGAADVVTKVNQFYRFTANRYQSAEEQGALFTDQRGHIIATAILWSPCAIKPSKSHCSIYNELTVFIHDSENQKSLIVDNLTAWAKKTISHFYRFDNLPTPNLDQVFIVSPASKQVKYP